MSHLVCASAATRSLMRSPGRTLRWAQYHPLKAPAPLLTEHSIAPDRGPVTVTCPRPMHAIVRDIERLAVTVSDPVPVPVTGPRATGRSFGSSCIGSKAAGRAGLLLHAQQAVTNTPVAATARMAFDLTCRAYQSDRLVVKAHGVSSGLDEDLETLAIGHVPVTGGSPVEVGGGVEDPARLDTAVEDVGHQLFDIGADRRGSAG